LETPIILKDPYVVFTPEDFVVFSLIQKILLKDDIAKKVQEVVGGVVEVSCLQEVKLETLESKGISFERFRTIHLDMLVINMF
jgi:hypothetical protein